MKKSFLYKFFLFQLHLKKRKKALDSLYNIIKINSLTKRIEVCIPEIISSLLNLIKTSNIEGVFDFIATLTE